MPKPNKSPKNDHAAKSVLANVPGLREAVERHKGDPINHAMTWRTPLDDMRDLACAIAFLQHDTPERRALLKAAGLKTDSLSPGQCQKLAENYLGVLESEDRRRYEIPWAKQDEIVREGREVCRGLNTHRMSEVVEQQVGWLWRQRFPLGKVSMLSGDPGLGKTWVTLDVISRITTGRPFPDSPSPFGGPRNALWISGEDDDADTILPRIRMLGGDPSRVHSLSFVIDQKKECTFDLSKHLDEMDEWLTKNPLVTIVAIDPIMAFLGKIDSHRNSDVRGLMTSLSKIAAKQKVAVVGINHLSKGDSDNAMYRAMGSIAFIAAARSAWMVTRDPNDSDRRLLTSAKNNLASKDAGGLAFRIGDPDRGIVWDPGIVTVTANEALRSPELSRAPQRAEAIEWLRDLLKEGSVPAADVWEKAEADKMCAKTLKSAKKELGVRTKKIGGTGGTWEWSLPK